MKTKEFESLPLHHMDALGNITVLLEAIQVLEVTPSYRSTMSELIELVSEYAKAAYKHEANYNE